LAALADIPRYEQPRQNFPLPLLRSAPFVFEPGKDSGSLSDMPDRRPIIAAPLPGEAESLLGLPPLEETRHSRESIIRALSEDPFLPSTEVAVAAIYVDHIAPDVLVALDRACIERLDTASSRLLFRGLHILGGRRVTAIYRPLIAFLRGPPDRVDELLGDAVTETLSKILAGAFDGDAKPLHALVADNAVDPYVREAGLLALSFLCFEARIDREGFETFLLRMDDDKWFPHDDDVMWHAWMSAVAILGIESLVPRVRAAFADGRISPDYCGESHFDDLLKAAIQRPDDRTRLAREQMGYIEDVLDELQGFHDPDASDDDTFPDDLLPADLDPGIPYHNPFRDVGRNDPCPCGSGKKFKKCCMQ
jgi:hypothetical protein